MTRTCRSSALGVFAAIALAAGVLLRPAAAAADNKRWGANYFPDVVLTTQNGDAVHFYDLIRDRIVAIDLIYTHCQYACPLESARLARAQQLLGDRMGRDIWFLSISIDPEHDTPEVLKAYGEKYHAGPGWIFLTGNMADIDLLSRKLGLWSDPKATQDGHTPMLLIGNEATGQWMQTSALDNPQYTVRLIGDWLNSWKTAKPGPSYAEAAPIKKLDNGKYLFTSLCSNCHTIGRGARIGPDLSAALDAHERDWLMRYTTEPDVMRARNDPFATALMKKYGEIRMPNLGLTPGEVASILDYIQGEKTRGATAATAAEPSTARPAAPAADASAGRLAAVVDPAIAIQRALADDTIEGVRDQAAAIRTAAVALGPAGAALERTAGALAAQTTVADARSAFGAFSDALVAYVRAHRSALASGVRVAYCPMARKSWLQQDGAVANPYYGRQMRSCGELID
jgi:protein SCO1